MIWDDITILYPSTNGKDALGNETFSLERSATIKGRATAPKDEQVSLEDRKIVRNEQTFLLPMKREFLKDLKFIEHKGQLYKVLSIEALTPRFTELQAVTYENHNFRR